MTNLTNKSQLAAIIQYACSEGSCQEWFLISLMLVNAEQPERLMKQAIKIILKKVGRINF